MILICSRIWSRKTRRKLSGSPGKVPEKTSLLEGEEPWKALFPTGMFVLKEGKSEVSAPTGACFRRGGFSRRTASRSREGGFPQIRGRVLKETGDDQDDDKPDGEGRDDGDGLQV